jgi:predicted GNAT family N-acyltransferase
MNLETDQTDVKTIDYGCPFYHRAAQLRYQLFYQEHNIPFDAIFDKTEPQDTHVAIVNLSNDNLIAYGRLAQHCISEYQIFQMVVAPQYQGQGYGTILLETLIGIAMDQGAHSIVLHARVAKTGFYQKLGFTAIGDVFASPTTGIPHVKMEKQLSP